MEEKKWAGLGIHWLHDKSEEAVRAAAGCTASYEFDTPLALSSFCLDGESGTVHGAPNLRLPTPPQVRHIDLDDELSDHIEPTPHPAEGFPGRW